MDLDDKLRLHRGKGCILDANLLLVVLVNHLDPNLVETCDKTAAYYELWPAIDYCLQALGPVTLVPNVVTEALALFRGVSPRGYSTFSEARKQKWAGERATTATTLVDSVAEKYIASSTAVRENCFQRNGLTDSCIISLARQDGRLVFTGDKGLARKLEREGLETLNIWNYVGTAVAATYRHRP